MLYHHTRIKDVYNVLGYLPRYTQNNPHIKRFADAVAEYLRDNIVNPSVEKYMFGSDSFEVGKSVEGDVNRVFPLYGLVNRGYVNQVNAIEMLLAKERVAGLMCYGEKIASDIPSSLQSVVHGEYDYIVVPTFNPLGARYHDEGDVVEEEPEESLNPRLDGNALNKIDSAGAYYDASGDQHVVETLDYGASTQYARSINLGEGDVVYLVYNVLARLVWIETLGGFIPQISFDLLDDLAEKIVSYRRVRSIPILNLVCVLDDRLEVNVGETQVVRDFYGGSGWGDGFANGSVSVLGYSSAGVFQEDDVGKVLVREYQDVPVFEGVTTYMQMYAGRLASGYKYALKIRLESQVLFIYFPQIYSGYLSGWDSNKVHRGEKGMYQLKSGMQFNVGIMVGGSDG